MTEPRPHRWLRFAGRIWEDLTFERETGWETERIARRPARGDGTWTVELLDASGQVLLDDHPSIRFDRGPGRPTGHIRSARVVAYLPLHPAARRVRFRHADYVVDERPLAAKPPSLAITRCEVGDDREVHLAWEAEHEGPEDVPLVFRVVYVAPGRGVFPVVRDVPHTRVRVPVDRLPGSRSAHLAVLASDGLRSAYAMGPAFVVPVSPARVAILEPYAGQLVPWGHPITLRGAAHDDAGRRLSDSGFVWSVDGEANTRDAALTMLPRLPPGEHTVVLAWEGAGAPRAETRTTFHVIARPPAEDPSGRYLHEPDQTLDQARGTLRIQIDR